MRKTAHKLTRAERLARLGLDLGTFEFEDVGVCDLCEGRRFIRIAGTDRYGLALTTVLCQDCGLVFLDPRPTAASYADFYARWYRPLVSAYSGRDKSPERLMGDPRRYAERLVATSLAPVLAHLRGGRFLDVGGSTGVVGQLLVERDGMSGIVIDPAPDEAAIAGRTGLETFVGFAEDFDPGEERFDLILLCQTIDHLLSPSRVLRRIRSWLERDGAFFVDPLDFQAVLRKSHHLSGSLKIDHPFYLTRETTESYFAKTGLTPVHLDVAGNFIHLAYLCRPGEPRSFEREGVFARRLYEEIRWVQATHALRHRSTSTRRRSLVGRLGGRLLREMGVR